MVINIKEELMAVRANTRRYYGDYSCYLSDVQQANDEYLDLVALLVLVPCLQKEELLEKSKGAGIFMQLDCLGQQVHNHLPVEGGKQVYQRPILIGDLLFGACLTEMGKYDLRNWLPALSLAHCKVNEARANREQWLKRAFVPEDERLENLQKEYGEFPVLASSIVSEFHHLGEEESDALAGFSYYVGIMAGMIRENFYWQWEAQVERACSHLSKINGLYAKDLLTYILEPLIQKMPDNSKYKLPAMVGSL